VQYCQIIKTFCLFLYHFFGRFVFRKSIAKTADDYLEVQLNLESSKKMKAYLRKYN